MNSVFDDYQRAVASKLESYQDARKRVKEEKLALATCEEELAGAKEAQLAVQVVAARIQAQAHNRIASVVSRCLEAVFDEPYEFKIIFDRKAGRTEARLVFIKDDNEIDPMTASGGGVVDVAAFALRLSCLLLSKPTLRRLLILDEPFRFVSAEYEERVAQLMMELSVELKTQIILVTHKEEFKIGKVVRISNGKGPSGTHIPDGPTHT